MGKGNAWLGMLFKKKNHRAQAWWHTGKGFQGSGGKGGNGLLKVQGQLELHSGQIRQGSMQKPAVGWGREDDGKK